MNFDTLTQDNNFLNDIKKVVDESDVLNFITIIKKADSVILNNIKQNSEGKNRKTSCNIYRYISTEDKENFKNITDYKVNSA